MSHITSLRRNRAPATLGVLVLALFVAVAAAPAAGSESTLGAATVSVEEFASTPITDTENPCGSAVGSADGFGVVTTFHRTDGSTRIVTRFLGHFLVDLTGDPIPNAWDPEATSLEGTLAFTTVEDSKNGFRLRLHVWGETDTGVTGRINQKLVAGPDGGYMTWNCFDGTGRHRVEL